MKIGKTKLKMSDGSVRTFKSETARNNDDLRYKVAYSGRGAAKSWSFARALLIQGQIRPLRILCAREIQKSIGDSVHKLLSDQIQAMGMSGFYEIQKATILGRNGTEFIFAGLKHNIDNIKSLESCDICWVEEAQTVSRESWEKLIPTIRKPQSEIWVSFNPGLDSDDTYKRFVADRPPRSKVTALTWRDNPWFPHVLRDEMEHLRDRDPRAYEHIWEGVCRSAVEGAIYEAEIRDAEFEGRICRVPYDRAAPVHTAWDLGFQDTVAIWMFQKVGFEYRIIDYLENNQKALNWYLKELQAKKYLWGTDYLPWDGGSKQLGTGMSIQDLMREAGRTVRVTKQLRVVDGINAVRTIFPQIYIDAERCADGLQGLRYYRWAAVSSTGSERREPLHDAASHPADAFRTMAVAIKRPLREDGENTSWRPEPIPLGNRSWMS
jgi:phage terminase large subunit